MTIQQAIQKAIEGGWKPKGQNFSNGALSYRTQAIAKVKYKERFFLDPLFWQSLGKAIGWIDKDYPNGSMKCNIKVDGVVKCEDRYWGYAGYKNPVEEWHRFIDHLSEGKSIESYFETIN